MNRSFSTRHFWLGFFGSILNTLGIVCCQNAIALGPAGPASALVDISPIILTVIEAFKNNRTPSVLEFVGLGCGTLGTVVLVVPDLFESLMRCLLNQCCICCKKYKNKEAKTGQEEEKRDFMDDSDSY